MKRLVIGIAAVGLMMIGAIIGTLVLRPKPQQTQIAVATDTTIAAHEQLRIVPPPIKEAEKEGTWKSTNSRDVSAPVTPDSNTLASATKRTAGAITRSGGISTPARVASPVRTPQRAASGTLSAPNPYLNSMFPEGSKWTTTANDEQPAIAPQTDASATPTASGNQPVTSADADSTSLNSVPKRAAPSSSKARFSSEPTPTESGGDVGTKTLNTDTPSPLPVPCPHLPPRRGCETIAPEFQDQCVIANRWRDDIGTKYGSVMQRHYRWLSAARYVDWFVNGCSPAPCDAAGTGRIQPADFYGAQGYDSPLGTCHSSTPTRRLQGVCATKNDDIGCAARGARPLHGMPLGTSDADGRIRGWVMWAGDGRMYVGTITDTECLTGCAVEFDHPCSIGTSDQQPFQATAVDGTTFYTWWYGGDANGEPPW